MQMQMDELITALKEIIETKGFDILDSKPYEMMENTYSKRRYEE